jgi:diguanylate cyclase (GGDEF)-like protein
VAERDVRRASGGSGLKRRIRQAAFGVAMLVAAAIVVAELLIALYDLPRGAREANETAARVIGAQISSSLASGVDEIDQLAHSSLVWTALTDSRGRDVYLKPFLEERNATTGNHRLALLDYRGRFVAGDDTLVAGAGDDVASLLDDVLASGSSASGLSDSAAGRFWTAIPVIFPYTQDVIGVLLGAADPREMIAGDVSDELVGRRVVLRGANAARVLSGDPAAPSYAPSTYRIRHPALGQIYDLTLEVHSTTNPWLSGLIARAVVLLLVSAVLAGVVWWLAGLAAKPVSRRLERLADIIVSNPGCGPEDIPEDDRGDEISVLGDALRASLAAHRDATEQLEQLAYFDPLTGLMNRALFEENLEQALRRTERNGGILALLFIDLDRFKTINDTLGHEAGDGLLVEVAERITGRVRRSDAVSRRSGDEFTVLLEQCVSQQGAARLAEALIARISRPYHLTSGATVVVGASIGIAFYPADAATKGELLSCADAAMYAAKDRGAGRYCVYSRDLGETIHRRLEMEARLGEAIEAGRVEIAFQPQVSLEDGRLRGFEALCRWRDPELGEVAPGVFIPIAEETGAIHRLGLDLLRRACREVSRWAGSGSDLFLSVNVSPIQLTGGFPAAVQRILKDAEWPASRLELEMTESSLMRAPKEAAQALDALHAMGVSVVMDDFGSGYSSLCYLRRFRFDKLKIDLGVIRNLVANDDDALMVSTIINLSHHLGLQVIAEGVETSAQRDRLLEYGCDMGQGYLYGKPVSAEELRSMLLLGKIA